MGLGDDVEAWEREGPIADNSRRFRALMEERRAAELAPLNPVNIPLHRTVVSEADALAQFREFLRDKMHLDVRGELISDGKWHSIPVLGDHGHERSGSYLLHLDGVINGLARNWKESITADNWRPRGEHVRISREEGAEMAALVGARRIQREADRLAENAAAVLKARSLIALSDPASADHPYLSRKLLDGTGFRQMNEPAMMNGHDIQGSLIVPLYIDGRRSGLQRIGEDGSKEYLAGAAVKGSYAVFGDGDDWLSRDGPLVIATGAASAASIYAATRRVTYAAGSDHNLLPVGEHVRARFPERQIIVAGDNDQWHFKPGAWEQLGRPSRREIPGDDPRWEQWRAAGLLDNPGAVKAVAAARAINATSVVPNIPSNHPGKSTDFSDVLVEEGEMALRRQLNTALELRPEAMRPKQTRGLTP